MFRLLTFMFGLQCLVINQINCDRNVERKLIKDYLKNQYEPNVVTAFLCWRKDDLFKLQLDFFESDSISVIHKLDSNFHIPYKQSNLIILDTSCEGSDLLLQKANVMALFRIEFHWLIFTDGLNKEVFRNLDVLVDSRVVLAQKVDSSSYDLSYVYKTGTERVEPIFQQLATWEYSRGFLAYHKEPVSWTRHDLMRQTLKTSFVIQINDSYNHLDDYKDTHVDTQLKINYKFIMYLAEYLNASLDIIFDRAWGEYIGNNTYTGVLGRIHRKEVDIGGSSLFCTKERLSFYDCIVTTIPVNGFFVFRQPPLSYVANIFVLPFEMGLWLINLLLLSICIFFIYMVVLWEWKIIEKTQEKPEIDMISPNFWETVLFTIGAVCQQGYATEPKSSSGRIITVTLFVAVIFLFTAYSANTVVLFQSTASHIKTLQDLYDSKMPMGVKDEPYLRFWFKNTGLPGSVRKKIYLDRIAPVGKKPHFLPLEKGVEKMREGYFAFFIDPISGYKEISDTFLEDEKCGLREITYLYVNNPMITAPKNTSYREMYYVSFRIMKERGIFKREMIKIFASKPQCISQRGSFRTAGILDLYAVYMIFFFGFAGSIIVLILELIHKKLIEKYIQKKNDRNDW